MRSRNPDRCQLINTADISVMPQTVSHTHSARRNAPNPDATRKALAQKCGHIFGGTTPSGPPWRVRRAHRSATVGGVVITVHSEVIVDISLL
jgi:hypothetical protein